jgi:hypothetical protein
MNRNILTIGFSFLLIIFCFQNVIGQTDSLPQKKRLKNTIRVNITNPVLFGIKNTIIGYERVVSKHQTFSIDFGVNSLPGKSNKTYEYEGSTLTQTKSNDNSGIHLSVDYRFYFAKENKYLAPRGIYFGPYYSYNSFNRKTDWRLISDTFDGNIKTDFSLDFHTVGLQLGYQFVIYRRLAIDFILLGPGAAFYNLNTKIDTDLSAENKEQVLETINGILADKIPGYSLVIDGDGFSKSGSANVTSAGFRYMINLGFRF